MSGSVLLTFNPGSSTIKLGLFIIKQGAPQRLGTGSIDLRHDPLSLHIVEGSATTDIPMKAAVTDDLHEVIDETLGWLASHFSLSELAAVGHRVVHGGDRFTGPTLITGETLAAIEALVPLAPMHQPAKRQADKSRQPFASRSATDRIVRYRFPSYPNRSRQTIRAAAPAI